MPPPADKAETGLEPAAGLRVAQNNLVPRHLTRNEGGKHAYLQSGSRVRIRRSLDGLNAAALHAAPLPTNVAAMKSMVQTNRFRSDGGTGDAGVIEVRWLALGNGPRNPPPSPSDTTDLTTTDIAGGTGAICKAEIP